MIVTNSIRTFLEDKLLNNDKYVDVIVSKEFLNEIIKFCVFKDIDLTNIDIEMDYYGLYYVSVDNESLFIESLYKYNSLKDIVSIPLLGSLKSYYISEFNNDDMSNYLTVKNELNKQEVALIAVKID